MPVYYNEAVDGPVEYYQNNNTGRVIGVFDQENEVPSFFYHDSNTHRNEVHNLYVNLSIQGYSKIIVPKQGDIIRLIKNNINPHSPHVNCSFKINKVNEYRIGLVNIITKEEINIDIRNWVWEKSSQNKVTGDSPKKPAIVINDGDIIIQDGKQFKVTLTQIIPEQKFRIGDVINNRIILEAEFKNNEWHYKVYYRDTVTIYELPESHINF